MTKKSKDFVDSVSYGMVIADLVDTREIQEKLELSRVQIIHTWIHRDVGFPEPVKVFHAGSQKEYRIWSWEAVSAWWEGWKEKTT